jgi:hypothetical protein
MGSPHAVLLNPMPGDAPLISISDMTVTEGHTGTSTANFAVTLSAASAQTITVQFLTANGTATSGADYQSTGGTLTFAPGQTTQTATVSVIGDRVGELNETFVVNLSQAVGGIIIGDGQGVGTIVDDEPRVSINDASQNEGNSGTTAFVFTVSLSAAYDAPVTMNYSTSNGSAKSGEDYVAQSGTLTFAPGQTSKSIAILVKGDKKKENNETFFVSLTSISAAMTFDGMGMGTIVDDDR